MEAFLQGQDLWELVAGDDTIVPPDTQEMAEARRKWKIKCEKALFMLRTVVNKELIDHIRDLDTPKAVWEMLEKLFSEKNIKNLCAEISDLDPSEKISESRCRRFIIGGLKNECSPFIMSIQGWANQPSSEELQNLLTNQELLLQQSSLSSTQEVESVLLFKGKTSSQDNEAEGAKQMPTYEEDEEESFESFRWDQCFTIEDRRVGQKEIPVNYIDYLTEWILDSGCSHHVIGNSQVFSEVHPHNGDRVIVTADNTTHHVEKEGTFKINASSGEVKLSDVYHVPGLKKNLISVSQITNSGKYVLFGPNNVKILNCVRNIDVDTILEGKRKDSLFVLSAGEAYVRRTSQVDSPTVWHANLGHVGYQCYKL
ncbi:gag-polypeptide of LTR copia-type [Sesbania bispinosa]|nr:gag-polypeptide of LTR copia-type [Sesbania bispinosa]